MATVGKKFLEPVVIAFKVRIITAIGHLYCS